MTTTYRPLDVIRAERAAAEEALEQAKLKADALRAEFARTILHETFPTHEIAIFSRHYDEEEPELLHILGGLADIEEWPLGTPGREAILEAETAIQLMGHDDDILEFLTQGEEHEGWIEFQLPLILRRKKAGR